MNQRDAINFFLREIPSLQERINRQDFFHCQVSLFATYTQEQIHNVNKKELKKCFEVARKCLLNGDQEVKNALVVSYLAHLNFADQKKIRSWAKTLLPELLKKELNQYEDYSKHLFNL